MNSHKPGPGDAHLRRDALEELRRKRRGLVKEGTAARGIQAKREELQSVTRFIELSDCC